MSHPTGGLVKALIRKPGPRLAEGLVSYVERTPVDHGLALEQWRAYADTLEKYGWETIEVEPADDCPDAVFVEDTMVVYKNVAVIARPGAEPRRPEVRAAEDVVEWLGYSINHIMGPATLDGGDILKVGDTIYVGRSERTNAEGVRQLRGILEPIGATVVAVPVSKVLHLKSAVTALPDGTVIGYAPNVDDSSLFPVFRAVPEQAGSHVVLLGEGRLLMAAGAPHTAELFSELGYEPVIVDISEFERLEGCVTCLSVRLRHAPAPDRVGERLQVG